MKTSKLDQQRIQSVSLTTVNFRKSRLNRFCHLGILTIIVTLYFLLFDRDRFLTNMEDPISLTPWFILISYPLIRYFFPFHIYKLDTKGITLKKRKYLRWSEIKSFYIYDNYDEVKNNKWPAYKLEINVTTIDDKKCKIDLSNYKIDNPELKAKYREIFDDDIKMKEALIKIFETFYEKYKSIQIKPVNFQ